MAIGGLSCSLSFAFMAMSPFFPFSTFSFPAISGLLLLPVASEIGFVTAALSYLAVAMLSFFLAVKLETAILFAVFFGYYPIVWYFISKNTAWIIRLALKLLVFYSFCLIFYVLFNSFAGYITFAQNNPFRVLLLIPLHFVFFLYDYAVGQFFLIYKRYTIGYINKKQP